MTKHLSRALGAAAGIAAAAWLAPGCSSPPSGESPAAADSFKERLAQFAPAVIEADLGSLPASERAALDKIIEASRYLDDVFLRQAYAGNPRIRANLLADTSPEGVAKRTYFDIMKGPWDRQQHHEPFAIDIPRPKGAGFYPSDMTKAEFEEACAASGAADEALKGLFTVVVRTDHGLLAVPYSSAYGRWLRPAARLLLEAADLTENASLATFLRSRARAFLSDDYYQSDKDWMDLDSRVEVTIGPYEVYEDELYSYKTSFESFVTVSDPDASADLQRFKDSLAVWEQALPIPDELKAERGRESPIRVVDLVYASGDARTSVQTIAFNLPNDERVRAEKGAKKVLLRNVIKAKFDRILRPLAERSLAAGQIGQLSADAFFRQTLFHELSHSLGPAYVQRDGEQLEVRMALGADYSAIEECKADVMGAYLVLYEIDAGTFPPEERTRHLTSYLTGLFRSVRFGVAEAHGKGAAVQINRYLEAGAIGLDPQSGRLHLDLGAAEQAITNLLGELLMLQAYGDLAAAGALLGQYGTVSDAIATVTGNLTGIPVDLRPIYPAAGEVP
jgi:hypothetical protein